MSVFERLDVRMAIGSAVMDEIIVDGPGTYSIVVPDRLIDRIASIVDPLVETKALEHG